MKFEDRESGCHGTGAFVSTVMRAETGLPFSFMDDEKHEFPHNKPCILLTEKDTSDGILQAVWRYAKELGIPEFGMHHFNVRSKDDGIFRFETETYDPSTEEEKAEENPGEKCFACKAPL